MLAIVPGDAENISRVIQLAPSASLGHWGLILLTSFLAGLGPMLDVTKSSLWLDDGITMEVSAVLELPGQPAHTWKLFLDCA